MMDAVSDMQAFVRIVELGSFSSAAQDLQIPKSTLSRRIRKLEDRLGVQLLARTTRSLTLTDIGSAYFERSRQIVREVEETEELIQQAHAVPRGTLRITVPPAHGEGSPFNEALVDFMVAYPEVELEVLCTERFVDLVAEGYDVAVRAGVLEPSSLRVRRLQEIEVVTVASPAYLAAHGTPQTLDALADHECLTRPTSRGERRWRLPDGSWLDVRGRLFSNNLYMLLGATRRGLGIAQLPRPMVAADLARGDLTLILPDLLNTRHGLHAVYPPSRHLAARVRVFIDFLVTRFEQGGFAVDFSL